MILVRYVVKCDGCGNGAPYEYTNRRIDGPVADLRITVEIPDGWDIVKGLIRCDVCQKVDAQVESGSIF